jgi:hypothetical protein
MICVVGESSVIATLGGWCAFLAGVGMVCQPEGVGPEEAGRGCMSPAGSAKSTCW